MVAKVLMVLEEGIVTFIRQFGSFRKIENTTFFFFFPAISFGLIKSITFPVNCGLLH